MNEEPLETLIRATRVLHGTSIAENAHEKLISPLHFLLTKSEYCFESIDHFKISFSLVFGNGCALRSGVGRGEE